jgi:lysyl-tRNA synthetase class 2
MLEWYRAGAPYEAIMEDTLALVRTAAGAIRSEELRFRGRTASVSAKAERLPVTEAFRRHAGIDLAALLGDRDGLASAAEAVGIRTARDDGWSDIFSRVLSEKVEPALGLGRMTLLTEYPAAEAALARPKPGDPRFAERLELYAAGVELANGFGELTDPAEQRRRFTAEMDEKMRVYGERYPLDEDFLAALAEMPPASGVALGLDRLVMLLTGAPRIDLVQWVPFDAKTGDTETGP